MREMHGVVCGQRKRWREIENQTIKGLRCARETIADGCDVRRVCARGLQSRGGGLEIDALGDWKLQLRACAVLLLFTSCALPCVSWVRSQRPQYRPHPPPRIHRRCRILKWQLQLRALQRWRHRRLLSSRILVASSRASCDWQTPALLSRLHRLPRLALAHDAVHATGPPPCALRASVHEPRAREWRTRGRRASAACDLRRHLCLREFVGAQDSSAYCRLRAVPAVARAAAAAVPAVAAAVH